METLLTRNELLNELYKLNSLESIWLTITNKGFVVCIKILTFDAIRLAQMLPNKSTLFNYEKDSSLAQ